MDAKLSRAVVEMFVRLLRGGPDLPRQAPRQLGPGAADRRVRSRGRERGGGRQALAHPLSARRRQRARSSSRRRGPRRCSATWRSRCIRTTSATRSWSARRVDAAARRAARSRSSPTNTSTASSAPACVKITPAHDFNDYAVGQRHELPMIGMLRRSTRRSTTTRRRSTAGSTASWRASACVADLEAQGLLVEVEEAQADGAALRPHRRRSSSRC